MTRAVNGLLVVGWLASAAGDAYRGNWEWFTVSMVLAVVSAANLMVKP